MGTISVRSDIKKFAESLSDRAKRQVPFAVKQALNATAKQAQVESQKAVPSVFNRPTPWTINSTYITFARSDNLEVSIQFKDQASRGTPAGKFLGPEILGGDRRIKRFERVLAYLGVGSDLETVPGKGAKLDQYGNISQAQIGAILDNLHLRRTKRSQRRRMKGGAPDTKLRVGDYYLAKGRDGKPLGIYQIVGSGKVTPILVFVRRVRYSRRLDYFGILEKSYRARFGENLKIALAEAMKTAK